MQRERGFTLIELLIVVAIVGVIAAIAIPNLINALNRSKQKRTMADMRSLALAWDARATEVGSYTAAGFEVCCTTNLSTADVTLMLAPTFMKQMHDRDGWGNDFEFDVDSDAHSYMIASYGRDGVKDATWNGGATQRMDCDILYSGGVFIQYPDGVQAQ